MKVILRTIQNTLIRFVFKTLNSKEDALAHYDLFRAKASINKDDIQFTEIKSPSDCATKCDTSIKIACKSFNYCPNSNICYLSERHFDDGSLTTTTSSSNDLACDHYSSYFF